MNLNINSTPPSQGPQFEPPASSYTQKMHAMSHAVLTQVSHTLSLTATASVGDPPPTPDQMNATGQALLDVALIAAVASQIAALEWNSSGNSQNLADLDAQALKAATDLMQNYQGKGVCIPGFTTLFFSGPQGGPGGMNRNFTVDANNNVTAINYSQFVSDFMAPSDSTHVGFVQQAILPGGFLNHGLNVGSWAIDASKHPTALMGFCAFFATAALSPSFATSNYDTAIWGTPVSGSQTLADLFPALVLSSLYDQDVNDTTPPPTDPTGFIADIQTIFNCLPTDQQINAVRAAQSPPLPPLSLPNYDKMYTSIQDLLSYLKSTPTPTIPPPYSASFPYDWSFLIDDGKGHPFGQPLSFGDFYSNQGGDIISFLFTSSS